MFEDECNRFTKIRETFFPRFALAVRTGDFGTIGDVPRAVLLDYRGELVAHIVSLALNLLLG